MSSLQNINVSRNVYENVSNMSIHIFPLIQRKWLQFQLSSNPATSKHPRVGPRWHGPSLAIQIATVGGRNPKANHLGCKKIPVNNGINWLIPNFWTINSMKGIDGIVIPIPLRLQSYSEKQKSQKNSAIFVQLSLTSEQDFCNTKHTESIIIHTLGPEKNPWKTKVLHPQNMGEVTSKNEGDGFPWHGDS